MKAFVTGGCGFIGSHLTRELIGKGHEVTVYDNMTVGNPKLLEEAEGNSRCRVVKGDICDLDFLAESMRGHDVVFHLAANANIPLGVSNTRIDLDSNTIGSYNVIEAMKRIGLKKIAIASSSAVYGEPPRAVGEVPENYAPLSPISLYGASKLAAEAYVTAYHHMFGLEGWVFRFANVVGPHGTHGVIKDFIAKLRKDSEHLEILGDGKQEKSFIHVNDCVDGILYTLSHAVGNAEAYNLGSVDTILVTRIAEIVVKEMGLRNVKFSFAGGRSGWLGDVPYVYLDTSKVRKLGFVPKLNSEQTVVRAVKEMLEST
jgi:UDP-glucose 4-epimerase